MTIDCDMIEQKSSGFRCSRCGFVYPRHVRRNCRGSRRAERRWRRRRRRLRKEAVLEELVESVRSGRSSRTEQEVREDVTFCFDRCVHFGHDLRCVAIGASPCKNVQVWKTMLLTCGCNKKKEKR